MSTSNVTIRMDAETKRQAESFFSEIGMSMSTACNIFIRQTLREGRIPFRISVDRPAPQTVEAMLEAERIARDPSVKGYTDLDELFAELKQ